MGWQNTAQDEIWAPSTVPFLPGNDVVGIGSALPPELLAAGFNAAIVMYSSIWDTSLTTPTVKFQFLATSGGSMVYGLGYANNPSTDPVTVVVTQILGELAINTTTTTTGGGNPAGRAPGIDFNMHPWYLTPPNDLNGDGVADTIFYPALATYHSAYFQEDSLGRMVMTAPVQGVTTSGASGDTRCEFRECVGTSPTTLADHDLDTTSNLQLTVTASYDVSSITDRKEAIIMQIHGTSGTPPFYVALDYTHSPPRTRIFENGPGLMDPLPNVPQGSVITQRLLINGGRVKYESVIGQASDLTGVWQYDKPSSTYSDKDHCYLKFGIYNKSTIAGGGHGNAIAYVQSYELIQSGNTYTGVATPGGTITTSTYSAREFFALQNFAQQQFFRVQEVSDGGAFVTMQNGANQGTLLFDASSELITIGGGDAKGFAQWRECGYLNGWGQASSPSNSRRAGLFVRRFPDGTVQLDGTLTVGTTTDGTQVAVLPNTDYCPTAGLQMVGGTANGPGVCTYFLNPSGQIIISPRAGNAPAGNMTFSGIYSIL